MTRDRIEFVVGEDYGELKKYVNDWLIKSENIRVKDIQLFRALVRTTINLCV